MVVLSGVCVWLLAFWMFCSAISQLRCWAWGWELGWRRGCWVVVTGMFLLVCW